MQLTAVTFQYNCSSLSQVGFILQRSCSNQQQSNYREAVAVNFDS